MSEAERDQWIDAAVGGVRSVLPRRGTCLQQSVLLERLLARFLPDDRFTLRLGSLHVFSPADPSRGMFYDPRGPGGVDDGFHAWVADVRGEVVDPSITITLAADGISVDPETVLQSMGTCFDAFGWRFVYEELAGLELLNVEASEAFLAVALEAALIGGVPPSAFPTVCPLDVGWRAGHGSRLPK